MNIIAKFEANHAKELLAEKKIPEFRPGDTLNVGIKIREGNNERLQYFQGLCIAKSEGSINASFTVRKISNGEGVEKKFPLYTPSIDSIEVVKQGSVKRSKLYYIRKLRGKAARIKPRKGTEDKK